MTDYNTIEEIKKIITETLSYCGVSATVDYEESILRGLIFNIHTSDSQLLIGRGGANLHSLEILVQAMAARKFGYSESLRFTLDIDDYRQKREWHLKELAKNSAEQAKRTGKRVTLPPLPNYERRLIHSYLQEHVPHVSTSSEGREPNRRIIIQPKNSGFNG